MAEIISKDEFAEREWFYDLLAGKTKTDWGSREWAEGPGAKMNTDNKNQRKKPHIACNGGVFVCASTWSFGYGASCKAAYESWKVCENNKEFRERQLEVGES